MPVATTSGVRISWDSKGEGSAVLLVMGAMYSSAMWYPVIDALATSHRVIWFDNRGIGQSETVRHGSIEDMAADAVAVLDAAGVDEAAVYGVSLGGVVAQQVAHQSPSRVSALVLGCTGILDDSKPRAPKVANLMAHLPASVFIAMGKKSYGSAATAGSIAADQEVLRREVRSAAGLKQQQDALRAYSVSLEKAATLTMPTLVLHGTEDKAVKYEAGVELASTLPNATLVTYEGAGHNYFVSYRDRANADVLAFLSTL